MACFRELHKDARISQKSKVTDSIDSIEGLTRPFTLYKWKNQYKTRLFVTSDISTGQNKKMATSSHWRTNKSSFLSREEELKLLIEYQHDLKQRGNGCEDTCSPDKCKRDAAAVLVNSFLPLVKSLASKFYRFTKDVMEADDLHSAGVEGLLIAARRFDPLLGFRFSTYAKWWILRQIHNEIRQARWIIHIPEKIYRKVLKYYRILRIRQHELRRIPTTEEIAERMQISPEVCQEVLAWVTTDLLSLDMPVGKSGISTLADFITNEQSVWHETNHDALDRATLTKLMSQLTTTLTPRELEVVSMRFGFHKYSDGTPGSLAWVAAELHYSRETIRRIETAAIKKMRQLVWETRGTALHR